MTSGSALRIEFAPAIMTRELTAYYLDRSLREIDELRAKGDLIAHGSTKRVYFKKSELDEWIDRQPERPVKERA